MVLPARLRAWNVSMTWRPVTESRLPVDVYKRQSLARVLRAEMRSVLARPYIAQSRSLGAGDACSCGEDEAHGGGAV